MRNKNHEQPATRWHGPQTDEFDFELDTALARYAAVEPTEKLEERVLANLRAQRTQVTGHAWSRWGLAGALAAVVLVGAVLAWRWGMASQPAVATHHSITTQSPPIPITQAATRVGNTAHPHGQVRKVERAPFASVASAANPKLDQFPSPQPLSEQEKILANYVAQFHRQAVLMAQVADEELQQDRLEMIGKPQSAAGLAEGGQPVTSNR